MKRRLNYKLLASVSRSFYLTLKTLPKSTRHCVSTAYLLARISDTIADVEQIPIATRQNLLKLWLNLVKSGEHKAETIKIIQQKSLSFIVNPHEKNLINNITDCYQYLARCTDWEKAEVLLVIDKIGQAQIFDLSFFNKDKLTTIEDKNILDTYLYNIAGCVGEFLTKVFEHYEPNFSCLPKTELYKSAINYGKGLQLINILRDINEDLNKNRSYLPNYETSFKYWHDLANIYLNDGLKYVQAIKSKRLYFSLSLPVLIGFKTLEKIPNVKTVLEKRQKISRKEIRKIMIKALLGTVRH